MLGFKKKKLRICLIVMLVSLAVMLSVFYATDDMTGDKDFSEYTAADWSVAAAPLFVIVVSFAVTLVTAAMILFPMIARYPALLDYVSYQKFSGIDPETLFLAFDHDEFKRACCHAKAQNVLWITVKEYDLKKRCWRVLEKGRRLENGDELTFVLKEDYGYDEVKFYDISAIPKPGFPYFP